MTRASIPGVAVVTINWNGWRNTLACLAALRATRGVAWRLIIVDNASTDESASHLVDLGDDVTTIWSPVNGGWTGGNNLGVAHALAAGYEHVLILNNDAFVEPDTLAEFLAAQAHAPGGVLGGAMKSEDGHSDGPAGSVLNPKTGTVQWLRLADIELSENGLRPAAAVMGAAMFAHRDVFEAVGPFDDNFYLYYDEIDWCARANKLGHACFFAERATLRHVGAASTGGMDSPLVGYFMTRNSLLFVERHSTGRQRLTMARIVLGRIRQDAKAIGAGWWPLTLLTASEPRLLARRRGVIDYLTRRFGDCPASVRQLQKAWRRPA